MKKAGAVLALLLMLLMLPETTGARAESREGEPDEWTVLFYLCGSDLESKYAYGTRSLQGIAAAQYPDSYMKLTDMLLQAENDEEVEWQTGKETVPTVNVLVETGGSEEWHTREMGMDVDRNRLQRWRFTANSIYEADLTKAGKTTIELLESLPLASMADPETLSDFIRWGVETCPAKKYALVLWDHGFGAKTGILADELFGGDVLYLYELKQALADGGVQFEALVFDACLMASIETAWAVKDSAEWMIASEEFVPGKGTAIKEWLQELYAHPECDGKQLGRIICDMTQIKYDNQADEQARMMLTWSVIDLDKTERLAMLAEGLFAYFTELYKNNTQMTMAMAAMMLRAEEYGDGTQHMRDLAGVIYNGSAVGFLDRQLRIDLADALSDMVVYVVRGSGRSEARGLSFCYPIDFDAAELDIYSKNCPSPHYLAFLDAVSDWTAPDWVFERVERLPNLDTIEGLCLKVQREIDPEGMPGVRVNNLMNLRSVLYRLYRVDEATGQTIMLGRTPCFSQSSENGLLWTAHEPMRWPSIEGVPCAMELFLETLREEDYASEYLYNVPVQIGSNTSFLRCGRVLHLNKEQTESYEIYGVWVGYNESTEMTSRNVKSLSLLAGQDFRMLYPVDSDPDEGEQTYQSSKTMTMYRSLLVEEMTLPPGTYYIEYEVTDMFLRPTVLDRIEARWDGEKLTFPGITEWAD